MSLNPWRCSILALGALTLSLVQSSCGKVADRNQLQLDSNTNWLVSCEADQQCSGSLRCYCGQCTQPCAQDDQCSLLSGAVCAASGEGVCGAQASPGGLCVLNCSVDAQCGTDFSCNAGQCVPLPAAPSVCNSGVFQDWDQLYALVASDLSGQSADDQPFLRYVSLAERYQDSDCSSALVAERQGLSKLLNSLSISASITQPVATDSGQRLYRIDLRDYDWDRPITLGSALYSDGWEALVASNPYAVPFSGEDADTTISATGTLVPVMLAGPLMASASEPEPYYALLEIPEDLSFLWSDLGIDPTDLPALQAGFVDGNEFLAQQRLLGVRAGYVWQISEFGRGENALFANPLDPPLGDQELIFTLPNGLHAFSFWNLNGRRMPNWQFISDPAEAGGVATAPRSNLRRHPLRVNVRDEVFDYVAANPSAFGAEAAAFIQQRFPGPTALALRLQQDYESFGLPALQQAGVDPGLREPITFVASDFDQEVTLERAANELMIQPDELRENLELLDPTLAPLGVPGGWVDRRTFTEQYRRSLCSLTVVLENQVDPALCQ